MLILDPYTHTLVYYMVEWWHPGSVGSRTPVLPVGSRWVEPRGRLTWCCGWVSVCVDVTAASGCVPEMEGFWVVGVSVPSGWVVWVGSASLPCHVRLRWPWVIVRRRYTWVPGCLFMPSVRGRFIFGLGCGFEARRGQVLKRSARYRRGADSGKGYPWDCVFAQNMQGSCSNPGAVKDSRVVDSWPAGAVL